MTSSDSEKVLQLLIATETVADLILTNQQELVALDSRRHSTREALTQMKKDNAKSVWTQVGVILMKLDRQLAIDLLDKDRISIEADINRLRDEQKVLVYKLRDLEHESPLKGFDLKPLDRAEMNAFKQNF